MQLSRLYEISCITIASCLFSNELCWALSLFFSHARDNKIHVWSRITAVHSLGDAADRPDSNLPEPALRYSFDVNALNFCRFSFLPVVTNTGKTPLHSVPSASKQTENAVALLAIPNLVDSALVCNY